MSPLSVARRAMGRAHILVIVVLVITRINHKRVHHSVIYFTHSVIACTTEAVLVCRFAALEAMKRTNMEDPAQDQVLYIFFDNMLLIRSMTEWISTWQTNQWCKADGNPVRNRDLLELLIQEQGKRRIPWQHVKAYTGKQDWKSKWNDVADQQAKRAARRRNKI